MPMPRRKQPASASARREQRQAQQQQAGQTSAGPSLGAISSALTSINISQACGAEQLQELQAALASVLEAPVKGDHLHNWHSISLHEEDLKSSAPPNEILSLPGYGRRITRPAGFSPEVALQLLPRLLSILEWVLEGLGGGPPLGSETTLHQLQQLLHGTVEAALDVWVAPRRMQPEFFQLMQRHRYLRITSRCLAYLECINQSTATRAQLAEFAETTLATMEAFHVLLEMLCWTERPALMAVAPAHEVSEAVYAAVAAPGMLPRLQGLILTVAEAAAAADGQPGVLYIGAAPCLAGSLFGRMLTMYGDRLGRIRSFRANQLGPLPEAAAQLASNEHFLAFSSACLATSVFFLRQRLMLEKGQQVQVPAWHEDVPLFGYPVKAFCAWQQTSSQLDGLRFIFFEAALACERDVAGIDAALLKLLLEALVLSRMADEHPKHGTTHEEAGMWLALWKPALIAPHEELTLFLEEAAGPLVDIVATIVEATWGPNATPADFSAIHHAATGLAFIMKPDALQQSQMRTAASAVVSLPHSLMLGGLQRRCAALVGARNGKLLQTTEAVIRSRVAPSTLHIPMLFFAIVPDTAPKMLEVYTQPRLAQSTYCTVSTMSKWLLAMVDTLRVATVPLGTAAASRSLLEQESVLGSMVELVQGAWHMSVFNALQATAQLARLATASFTRGLYWLDERLVPPVPEDIPPERRAELQRRHAIMLELLCSAATSLGQSSPHDIDGIALQADGSIRAHIREDVFGHSDDPASSMAAAAEQLSLVLEAQQRQEEERRQQRRARKQQRNSTLDTGSTTSTNLPAPDSTGSSNSSSSSGSGGGSGSACGSSNDMGTGNGVSWQLLRNTTAALGAASSAAGAAFKRAFETLADLGPEQVHEPVPFATAAAATTNAGSGPGSHDGHQSSAGSSKATADSSHKGPHMDLSAMAVLVACRAAGAVAAAWLKLRRLVDMFTTQPFAITTDGSGNVLHDGPSMTPAAQVAEAHRMIRVIDIEMCAMASVALKLSALLCPRLPPSQAAVLTAAANTSRRGADWWLPVAAALQHVRPPKPPGCWNPCCANLEGRSEADLPTRKCSRCQKAKYCSAKCQKVDWKVHKEVCGSMDSSEAAVA